MEVMEKCHNKGETTCGRKKKYVRCYKRLMIRSCHQSVSMTLEWCTKSWSSNVSSLSRWSLLLLAVRRLILSYVMLKQPLKGSHGLMAVRSNSLSASNGRQMPLRKKGRSSERSMASHRLRKITSREKCGPFHAPIAVRNIPPWIMYSARRHVEASFIVPAAKIHLKR